MKKILIAFFIVILFFWGFAEIQTQIFMRPNRSAIEAEIRYFTGYTLPVEVEVIKAFRTRPSPLLGDHTFCAMLRFDKSDFENFLSKFSKTEKPSLPGDCAFNMGAGLDMQLYAEYFHDSNTQPDEYVNIYTQQDKNIIILEAVTH